MFPPFLFLMPDISLALFNIESSKPPVTDLDGDMCPEMFE
jgi:hypothetical protein